MKFHFFFQITTGSEAHFSLYSTSIKQVVSKNLSEHAKAILRQLLKFSWELLYNTFGCLGPGGFNYLFFTNALYINTQ